MHLVADVLVWKGGEVVEPAPDVRVPATAWGKRAVTSVHVWSGLMVQLLEREAPGMAVSVSESRTVRVTVREDLLVLTLLTRMVENCGRDTRQGCRRDYIRASSCVKSKTASDVTCLYVHCDPSGCLGWKQFCGCSRAHMNR